MTWLLSTPYLSYRAGRTVQQDPTVWQQRGPDRAAVQKGPGTAQALSTHQRPTNASSDHRLRRPIRSASLATQCERHTSEFRAGHHRPPTGHRERYLASASAVIPSCLAVAAGGPTWPRWVVADRSGPRFPGAGHAPYPDGP
jgi:hypothetical protein